MNSHDEEYEEGKIMTKESESMTFDTLELEEEIVELGVASVETRGAIPQELSDSPQVGGFTSIYGLTDD